MAGREGIGEGCYVRESIFINKKLIKRYGRKKDCERAVSSFFFFKPFYETHCVYQEILVLVQNRMIIKATF